MSGQLPATKPYNASFTSDMLDESLPTKNRPLPSAHTMRDQQPTLGKTQSQRVNLGGDVFEFPTAGRGHQLGAPEGL